MSDRRNRRMSKSVMIVSVVVALIVVGGIIFSVVRHSARKQTIASASELLDSVAVFLTGILHGGSDSHTVSLFLVEEFFDRVGPAPVQPVHRRREVGPDAHGSEYAVERPDGP